MEKQHRTLPMNNRSNEDGTCTANYLTRFENTCKRRPELGIWFFSIFIPFQLCLPNAHNARDGQNNVRLVVITFCSTFLLYLHAWTFRTASPANKWFNESFYSEIAFSVTALSGLRRHPLVFFDAHISTAAAEQNVALFKSANKQTECDAFHT